MIHILAPFPAGQGILFSLPLPKFRRKYKTLSLPAGKETRLRPRQSRDDDLTGGDPPPFTEE
jgi:hypothetical protein